jgi:ABC-type transport system involved in multi-copper enzyme maturation permease subunit
MAAITINPVLSRELKERMRGRRAAVIITIYLLVLCGILALTYEATAGSNVDPFGPPAATQVAALGRGIFEWLLFFMLLLVLFLVPAQTAGAIAGERERQTLVPLQITLLRPRSILLGKIGASTAFLILLVVATLPLLSISYLVGGVTIAQVLGGLAIVVASGVALAALCAAISTFTKRVQTATVLSYALSLALAVGTFVVYGAAAIVDQSRGTDQANPPAELLLLNPVVAVADAVGGASTASSGVADSPFRPLKDLLRRDQNGGTDQFGRGFVNGREVVFDQNGNPVPVDQVASDPLPFWQLSMASLAALAVLAIVLASRRLRTPAATER